MGSRAAECRPGQAAVEEARRPRVEREPEHGCDGVCVFAFLLKCSSA